MDSWWRHYWLIGCRGFLSGLEDGLSIYVFSGHSACQVRQVGSDSIVPRVSLHTAGRLCREHCPLGQILCGEPLGFKFHSDVYLEQFMVVAPKPMEYPTIQEVVCSDGSRRLKP